MISLGFDTTIAQMLCHFITLHPDTVTRDHLPPNSAQISAAYYLQPFTASDTYLSTHLQHMLEIVSLHCHTGFCQLFVAV